MTDYKTGEKTNWSCKWINAEHHLWVEGPCLAVLDY